MGFGPSISFFLFSLFAHRVIAHMLSKTDLRCWKSYGESRGDSMMLESLRLSWGISVPFALLDFLAFACDFVVLGKLW